MKDKNLHKVIIAVLIGATLLSGCGNKEAEQKETYRNQGITFMEKGDYVAAISSFEAALKQGIGSVTKNDLDRDMERTKLTRLLRTLYDSKVEEESKLKK